MLAATRLDLMLAFPAVLLSPALGIAIGAIIGYRGGVLDGVTSRLVDVPMAFPLFVLALAVVAFNLMGDVLRDLTDPRQRR